MMHSRVYMFVTVDTSDLLPGKGCKETDAHNSVLHIATVAEGSDTDYEKLLCAFQEEMGRLASQLTMFLRE